MFAGFSLMIRRFIKTGCLQQQSEGQDETAVAKAAQHRQASQTPDQQPPTSKALSQTASAIKTWTKRARLAACETCETVEH